MAYDAGPFPMPVTRLNPMVTPPVRRGRWLALRVVVFCGFACCAEAADTVRCPLADGFDFPVGKPEAAGYHKARGFYPNGHLGEDWNGNGGGDSDLGDPIYAIGTGVVVHSDNVGVGWGNVVIVRHAFRDAGGKIEMVDSLYGHLLERRVKLHQIVERGQLVGTMGSNNGMYPVHLHLEVRKNLQIGMNRSQFARDYSNYYSPTQFISARRRLPSSLQKFEMPVRTFAPYGKTLAEADLTSGPSRSINIPVFQGNVPAQNKPEQRASIPRGSNGPALILTPKGGKSGTVVTGGAAAAKKNSTAQAKPAPAPPPSPLPTRPAPAPAPPSPPPQDDFWGRMKAKLKQGGLSDGAGAPLRTNR